MRALAAKQITHDHLGNEIIFDLIGARIDVLPHKGKNGRYGVQLIDASFTSLHRAKNAIRRHFGIPSRKSLIWIEETR